MIRPGAKHHRATRVLAILVLACLYATQGFAAPWQKITGGKVIARTCPCSINVPSGWSRMSTDTKGISLTRMGPGLQLVRVGFLSHQAGYQEVGQSSRPGMLASELADLMFDKIRRNNVTRHSRVISSRPFSLRGRTGFRLLISFKSDTGLRFYRLVYGLADKRGLYFLLYQAPVLYYYKKDLKVFEKMVRSFRSGN